MREVKETAQNLDRNIRMFKNGGSSRVSKESLHENNQQMMHHGYGSSFRPSVNHQVGSIAVYQKPKQGLTNQEFE